MDTIIKKHRVEIDFGNTVVRIPDVTKSGNNSKTKFHLGMTSSVVINGDKANVCRVSGDTPNEVLNKIYHSLRDKGYDIKYIRTGVSIKLRLPMWSYKTPGRKLLEQNGRKVFKSLYVFTYKPAICNAELMKFGK